MTQLSFSTGSFRLAQAETPAQVAPSTPTEPHGAAAVDGHAAASGAETHAGTTADGGAGGHRAEFPPFAPQYFLGQIIWLAITFGALYYILSRYALPRVGAILADRTGRIDADLGEAHRLRGESDAAMTAYEEALTSARARAQSIAGETRDAVAREADTRRKALEQALADKLGTAEAQIAATKTAAMSNVRGIASDTASEIVKHLIGVAPAVQDVEQAVDAALRRAAA